MNARLNVVTLILLKILELEENKWKELFGN